MSRPSLHARWAAVALCVGAVAVPSAPAQAARDRCDRPASGGDTTLQVRFGGTSYSVLVYVPAGTRRNARLPVVLNLHGSQANGPVQMEVSGLRAVAGDEGFLIAAPSVAIPLHRKRRRTRTAAGRGMSRVCRPLRGSCRRPRRATTCSS